MKQIAVLVSGGGTNLQALIDAQNRGELIGGRICAVISSSASAYALARAKAAGIDGHVLSKKDFASTRELTIALTKLLQELHIDLVVMAGFMLILTEEIIRAYEHAIINVHPSLIPSFSGPGCYGLHVHEQALSYGVKLTGATVHFVSQECDAGPIILQQSVAVAPNDTPETLQRRVMEEAEWTLLPQAVSLFCQDRLQVVGRTVHIRPASNKPKGEFAL